MDSEASGVETRMEESSSKASVKDLRGVLTEVKRNTVRPVLRDADEKMDTEGDNERVEKFKLADWSTLRATLEASFGDIGKTNKHGKRGAELRSKKEKGHLEFTCRDGCLKDTKLGDLQGVQLPGAFSARPLGSLWNAWRAASIFIRTDIDTATKIKFWKDGAVCLDEEALRKVLRLAYDRCLDWTEFICVTEEIKSHERIEDFTFEKTYDSALKALKRELQEEEKEKRTIKEGPTAYAAPLSGALLEKDGPERGISTRVAATFKQLREILCEWRTHMIWVIVWPMDRNFGSDEVCEVVKACHRQFEEGGRIVTAWPPIVEKNSEIWRGMVEIWTMLDEAVGRKAGAGQFINTANTRIEKGRIFCEVGSPESCLSFFGTDSTVACAKILYDTIRKKAMESVVLPELRRTYLLPRTAAGEGGGMSAEERSRGRPVKRRDFGGRWRL